MTILAQLRSKHIAPYTKSNNTKCSDVNSRLHETVPDRKIVDPRALGTITESNSVLPNFSKTDEQTAETLLL